MPYKLHQPDTNLDQLDPSEVRDLLERAFNKPWVKRVAENLLPLSEEKEHLIKAMREWIYEGVMKDAKGNEEDGGFSDDSENMPDCELCDHPEIRYQFQIINQFNQNELWVGSSCITKFSDEIGIIDENGDIKTGDEVKKKVDHDRNEMIKEAKRKNVIFTLNLMRPYAQNDFIDGLISHFEQKGNFTPKQLLTILLIIRGHDIKFKPHNFKMGMRRNREKEQLEEMTDDELRHLWRSLSANQKKWVIKMRKEQGRPEKK